jgi:tetratricopeptide (TPR) repeat protein
MTVSVEQVMQQALIEHSQGNTQEAERLYNAVLKLDPMHSAANHNLGVMNISLGQVEVGLPLLKTALEQNSNNEQFWISYTAVLIQEGQFEDAKKKIKEARDRGFKDEKFDSLESKLPSSDAPSHNETNALIKSYQSGKLVETTNLAVSIIKEYPDHLLSWKLLGAIFGQSGQLDNALAANKKAVQLAPNDSYSHNNLSLTLNKLNMLEEAEVSAREAIKLKPDLFEAHINLGKTLQGLGRLAEAEVSYRKTIELKPDFIDAHYCLGMVLNKLGNLEKTPQGSGRLAEAEVCYRKTIELKPDFIDAHYNLGVVLDTLGRLDEALILFDKALNIKQDDSNSLLGRAKVLFDKGEFELALKDFYTCNTAESRLRALESLYALGRIDDIYNRIELYSELDDENIGVAAFSSFIAEKQKKDTAHKFCKKPMNFIYYSNISMHIENSNAFINEVSEELKNIKTHWEPLKKTTHNGFQSTTNLFQNPSGKILNLQSIIINELDSYKSKFKNESCSYIQKWPSKKNLIGWHVILKKKGYQAPHTHRAGWLSGVIYLKVVPPLEKNEGAIEFNLSGDSYSDINSPKLIFEPKLGDIVFFPSSLFHRTIPFTTDADRITVSFDLVPNKV